MLRLADQIWVSDNTEGMARLAIQEGFSYIFPPNTMEAWVTDANSKHLSIAFRTHLPPPGEPPLLYLRGLDPAAKYRVEGVPGARSGMAWMRVGLRIDLDDFTSTVRHIQRV